MNKPLNIRVIAPSHTTSPKKLAKKDLVLKQLSGQGYAFTYSKNILKQHRFGTGSIKDRLTDLHDAYKDKKVDAIICLSGGWSVNAILPHIDWEVIKANPKPLIGYSDITALVNAIYAKTGQKALLGPTLGVLGENFEADYTLRYLDQVLCERPPITLRKSQRWSPRDRRNFSTAWKILQKGSAEGVALGGNLGTLYLLQGTEYMPKFDRPTILVIEDDDESGKSSAREFDRRLESLLQQPGVRKNVQGVLIGRFLPESRVSLNDVKDIMSRANLPNIPIVANMDFGHTVPMFTIPIGGKIKLKVENNISCEILET